MSPALHVPGILDELEALMDRAWRAPGRETIGGWVLRSAGSVTQRANSVWPAAGTADAEAALRTVEAWYAARGQPVIFQLTDRPENTAVHELLDRHGYSRQSETLIMVGDAARAQPAVAMTGTAQGAGGTASRDGSRRTLGTAARDGQVLLAGAPSEEWLELWWRVDGRGGAAQRHVARSIMLGTPSVYASAVDGTGTIVGTGRLSVLDNWGGVYCMATHPEFRRRGVAAAVLGSLMEAGRGTGAANFWLMATEANTGARALYESAGFAEASRYHYRQAPLRRAPSAC